MGRRKWDADDRILRSPHAPHEVAAVLRMHRAGWPAPAIAKSLGMRASKLVGALSKAMFEANQAAKANRDLHQECVKEGTE